MKITTEGIIKVLPFDQAYRDQLFRTLPTMEPDKKASVEQVLWDTYFALYKLKFDENLQLELQNITKNNLPMNEEFYTRVNEKTEQDMLSELVEGTITTDLTHARTEIDRILNDGKPAPTKSEPAAN